MLINHSIKRIKVQAQLRAQRGSTLIISLLFLMVTTLIATGVWRLAMQQESMTGSEREYQIAFEAAEAALRDAELDYFNVCARINQTNMAAACVVRAKPIVGLQLVGAQTAGDVPPDGSCSDAGLCLGKFEVHGGTKLYEGKPNLAIVDGSAPVSLGKRVTYGQNTRDPNDPSQKIANVSQQPSYVIEAICLGGATSAAGCNPIYRVTAIGYGRRADTRVVLQSFLEPPPPLNN